MIKQIGESVEWTEDGQTIRTIIWSDDKFLGDNK